MFNIDVLTLLALFGTLQGLLFAVIFWFKNRRLSNRLFSILLLATSIRIAKNIFVHLRDLNPEPFWTQELWDSIIYFGLAHQFAIGPLFMFHFLSKLRPKFAIKKIQFLHFLPYAVLVVICPFINWDFWANGGLLLSYISILIYFVLSVYCFFAFENAIGKSEKVWLGSLLIFTGLMILVYSPALFEYMGYIGGAVLYTIAILSVGYVFLTHKKASSIFRKKYETSFLKDEKVSEIREKLEKLIIIDKPFLDPELNIESLSKMIGVHPHQLSQVINKEYDKSYAEYINRFRLEEASNRLKNPVYDYLKISALAYDCGFNSQPTFNTLFKKRFKITPSEFRNISRKS